MSDANLASLAFLKETTIGTVPATPALQSLRMTGESFKFSKETVQSAEIRSDRQVSDLAKVGSQPDGSFNFELSYAFILPFLAAALQAEWASFSFTGTAAIDDSSETITGAAADFADIPVGALVKVSGAATTANNGLKRVTAKNADSSVLTFATGSFSADEASPTLTLRGSNIRNGTTRQSYLFEKGIKNSSGTTYYQRYLGMVADKLDLKIESKAICTGTLSFVGMSYDIGGTSIDAAGGYAAAETGSIMNGTSNVGSLTVDGVTATDKFKSINLSLANNVRGKDAIGVDGNFDIGLGTISVTGSFNAYFLDNTLPTKIKAHTTFALGWSITDLEGNSLYFWLPAVKPAAGDPAITAINTDVMIETSWQAIMDPTTGATVIIDAISAA
jgi:hypothetical protein